MRLAGGLKRGKAANGGLAPMMRVNIEMANRDGSGLGNECGKRIAVVHVITELNVGGAERMLEKLVLRMDRKKFSNHVVSMTDVGSVGERIAHGGIPVCGLGMKRGRPGLGGATRLARLLKTASPDIVQTWLYHADLLGLIIGRMAGVKRVIWGIRCSNMNFHNYGRLTGLTVRINAMLSSLTDAIVVNSEAGKEVHRRLGFASDKMETIPNGFDVQKYAPDESERRRILLELNLPSNVILIGLVARWDPMKDQTTFLKAASVVARRNDTVHFVMVGLGMEESNESIACHTTRGVLRDRVHLLGMRKDISGITAALDIACSSSAYGEGCPNSIGEAMACGVPCVVTDVGDSARIVGDTGRVVPPQDPAALVNAWSDLIALGREGRRRLGMAGRRRIEEHFEISRIVAAYERLYALVVNRECSCSAMTHRARE
jgi:glycosyltransferase involved in cell wall biosynthesis